MHGFHQQEKLLHVALRDAGAPPDAFSTKRNRSALLSLGRGAQARPYKLR